MVPSFIGQSIQTLAKFFIGSMGMSEGTSLWMSAAILAVVCSAVSVGVFALFWKYKGKILRGNEVKLANIISPRLPRLGNFLATLRLPTPKIRFSLSGWKGIAGSIGMVAVGSIGLILSDYMSFNSVFLYLSSFMCIGILTTLACDEGDYIVEKKESIIEPLLDYFRKNKAIVILLFLFMYKIGDMLAFFMGTPYYMDLGYTKSQIGYIKFISTWMTLFGSFVGGLLMVKYNNIMKGLFYFGLLQMISTFGYVILGWIEPSLVSLGIMWSFETFCAGLGMSVFISYIALLTNVKFTQYALLSSFVAVPRTIFTSQTGFLVETVGWEYYFIFCTLIAIPGLLLIRKLDE